MKSPAETARMLFMQALADASVEKAVIRHVTVRDNHLHIGQDAIPLDPIQQFRIVAVGKAAGSMLAALLGQLSPLPDDRFSGVLIAPQTIPHLPPTFQYFHGGHPTPNQASFDGARAALDLLRPTAGGSAAAHALCLFLVSGGASAMMELPFDPAIDLAETQAFHRTLVASGASISEINCVRKHFSGIKGGRLALAAGEARSYSLLISDVPAGHEDALGSGPTLPDRSTAAECREILVRYGLLAQFPARVRQFFEHPDLPETPKPAELDIRSSVLLCDRDLAQAAARRAEACGWTAIMDDSADEQDYRALAESLVSRLRSLRKASRRVCLISAGEVLVRLPAAAPKTPKNSPPSRRATGIGGRNQQFALYAATLLRPDEQNIAILSAGSDGIDGNSAAAGAVVDFDMVAGPLGVTARRALEEFDAYSFLSSQGATIVTGPTGNNLRDLRILLSEDPPG